MSQPTVLLKRCCFQNYKQVGGRDPRRGTKASLLRGYGNRVLLSNPGTTKLKDTVGKATACNISKPGCARWLSVYYHIAAQSNWVSRTLPAFSRTFQRSPECCYCDFLTPSCPDTGPWLHPRLIMTASVSLNPHHHQSCLELGRWLSKASARPWVQLDGICL